MNKEEILKELKKKKSLFKCWGLCKKEEETRYCPRCLEVLWGLVFLLLVLVGLIIFLIICILNILKKK